MIFSTLYYQCIEDCSKSGFTCYEKRRPNACTNMLTKIQCIGSFNTCAARFIILHKFNTCTISLDRLRVRPLENFFGYLRYLCRSNDMIDNLIRQICKLQSMHIDSGLHIQKNIH